ncbi:translation initiation factor eIF 4e-like domain-containing protein [Mucor lusitanicus]|uniref:Translation initiation factor eIF4e n=1 Tax=Mucor lusitanicus CBS 277.49 TaxID=747725 RepID=A0A168HC56_MUCCL|nr:hypothetical protein MUCCIDRAFT_115536 [Mucor lusitanicus CBS 277.49]
MSPPNYKLKPLSPAISAFQFPGKQPESPLRCVTSPTVMSDDYFGQQPISSNYHSNKGKPAITLAHTDSKDEYVYRNKVIILDKETKQKLRAMGEIPLENEWTFWYDKFVPNLPATDYEANLQVISSAKTLQKFWAIHNNIDGPDKLGFRSTFHFMKKGIKPIWEDPHNEYGGSYNFKINKQHTVLAWRDILVLLIGENMDWIKNTVYGVSVSCRQHVDNYQIWTAHSNSKINDTLVKSTLTELLYPADIQSFYFKMHKSHADFKPTTPTTPTLTLRPIELRTKITEESIEKVVQDIERLKLRVQ